MNPKWRDSHPVRDGPYPDVEEEKKIKMLQYCKVILACLRWIRFLDLNPVLGPDPNPARPRTYSTVVPTLYGAKCKMQNAQILWCNLSWTCSFLLFAPLHGISPMVLLIDRNSDYVARVWRKTHIFLYKQIDMSLLSRQTNINIYTSAWIHIKLARHILSDLLI